MKQKISRLIEDLVCDFTYYDRKEDEELSVERLEQAVLNNEITIDEMVTEFRRHLIKYQEGLLQ